MALHHRAHHGGRHREAGRGERRRQSQHECQAEGHRAGLAEGGPDLWGSGTGDRAGDLEERPQSEGDDQHRHADEHCELPS